MTRPVIAITDNVFPSLDPALAGGVTVVDELVPPPPRMR